MPKSLTPAQIEHYRTQGYVHPLSCMDAAAARGLLDKMEAFERETGLSVTKDLHFKFHLYFTWLMDVARSPALLDPVEDLIGPDILAFTSNFWIKRAGDGAFVSWHQDSAYFGLDPHELCAAWIALTPSTRANGCMRVMPGSHLEPSRTHVESYDPKNLLSRGQRIDGLDEARAVDLVLQPGEFSLHNERTIHGSLANNSTMDRIGFAIFFIPTRVRSTIGRRTAWLVRGTDRYGHWDPDPMPRFDRDPIVLEHMNAAYRRYKDKSVRQEAVAEHHP
jgi:hypothetical protein